MKNTTEQAALTLNNRHSVLFSYPKFPNIHVWSEIYAHILAFIFLKITDQMVDGAVACPFISGLLKIDTIPYIHFVLLIIPRLYLSVYLFIQV